MAPAHTKPKSEMSQPASSAAPAPNQIREIVARIHDAVHGGTLDVAAVDVALADLSCLIGDSPASVEPDAATAD